MVLSAFLLFLSNMWLLAVLQLLSFLLLTAFLLLLSDYQTYGYRTVIFFLLSNYQNIEYHIDKFNKLSDIGYRIKALTYRISD